MLGRLTRSEADALPAVLDEVEGAVDAWLSLDIQVAMSRVNAPKVEL